MNEIHDETIDALLRRQFNGPVTDDGFSDKVMQCVPPRRRRAAWPLWLGVTLGAGACGACLIRVPLLHAGCQDWLAGRLSASAIGLLLATAAMSLLAMSWGLLESRSR